MIQLPNVNPCCGVSSGKLWFAQHNAAMSEPDEKKLQPVNFIRAWRKKRGYTLERVADAAGMDKGNLSKIERRVMRANLEQLERIADALECSSSDLLMNDPEKPGEVLEAWSRANSHQKAQIRAVAEAIVGYGEPTKK